MDIAVKQEFNREVFGMLMKKRDENTDENYELFKNYIDEWRKKENLKDEEWDCEKMRGLYALICKKGLKILSLTLEYAGLYENTADFARHETEEWSVLPSWLVVDWDATADELETEEGYIYIECEEGCYVFADV